MALTMADIIKNINPNIGVIVNPDGSFRIGVEDVNSDEILAAVEALVVGTILAAGTATIGKLAANSGVDIGDVDVTSLPSVSTATPTKKAIGNTDTQVIVANAARIFATFVNDSDEIIYLSLSATAVMNEGIRLNANGGAYEINLMNLYTGEVSAICASGGKNLTVTEG